MNRLNSASQAFTEDDFADGFLGKYLLVGITRLSSSGEVLSQQQLHGVIVRANAEEVELELCGIHAGKTFRMPPIFDEFAPAKRGIYELKTTDEFVEDPDFVFTVVLNKVLH